MEAQDKLMKYAYLTEEEAGGYNYMQIFESVVKFVEDIKIAWKDTAGQRTQEALQKKVHLVLPLGVIMGDEASTKADVFKLWFKKATTGPKKQQISWTRDDKELALKELFGLFDADNDGNIDSDELHASMQALGLTVDDELREAMAKEFDKDNSGAFDLKEFDAMVSMYVRRAFRFLVGKDKCQKGQEHAVEIAPDDLKRVVDEIGYDPKPTEKELTAMIQLMDRANPGNQAVVNKRGDGKISLSEFEELIFGQPPDAKSLALFVKQLGGQAPKNKVAASPSMATFGAFKPDPRVQKMGGQQVLPTMQE